jgi:hypothetical protein
MSRKKSKRKKHKQHPAHHHPVGGDKLTDKPDHVHVDGKIETTIHPDLVKKYDTEQEKQDSREDTRLEVEIATLIILFIYTAVAAWQGCSNQRAATAAKNAAKAAGDNLSFAQQQFRLEQRPYLSPVPRGANVTVDTAKKTSTNSVFFTLKDSSIRSLIAVDLQSIGKSPAIEVDATSTEYKVGPSDQAREATKKYRPEYSGGVGVVQPSTFLTPASPGLKLTKQEYDWLIDGTWEFYVVGGVKYRDIFSPTIAPYESTYCYRVVTSGMPFVNCDFKPPDFTNSIK